MKKLFVGLLSVIFLFSCNRGYIITGEAPEGVSSVVLLKLVGKNAVPIDTVKVNEDGVFCFNGFTDSPFVAYISDVDTDNPFTDICVSNDDINVNLCESGYEVHGGSENAKYFSLCNSLYQEQLSSEQMYNVMDSVINEDPSCTAYSYILFRRMYPVLSLEQSEELESRFSEEVRSNCYLTILRELISQSRQSMPGNPCIDFQSYTPSGDTISLSSLNGKWVLVDFWASWCPYCRKENPILVELYDIYHPKGLEILSVSLDKNHDAWIKAIEDDGMRWLHVSNLDGWECKAARMYGISAIPGNVLISPDGMIAYRQLHDDYLIQTFNTIFQK